MADQGVDGQIILNQPHVSRPGVFQELGAGISLLGIFGVVLQLPLHVEEDETDGGEPDQTEKTKSISYRQPLLVGRKLFACLRTIWERFGRVSILDLGNAALIVEVN